MDLHRSQPMSIYHCGIGENISIFYITFLKKMQDLLYLEEWSEEKERY